MSEQDEWLADDYFDALESYKDMEDKLKALIEEYEPKATMKIEDKYDVIGGNTELVFKDFYEFLQKIKEIIE